MEKMDINESGKNDVEITAFKEKMKQGIKSSVYIAELTTEEDIV